MERKTRNNIFQMKITSSSEKENIFPSRYIKEKYPHLNKVVPKNSILFKVRYKPDIIINQYNQISNNINANLKIKPTPSLLSKNRYNNQNNFNPQNKYYNEFTNNTLLNYLDENDFNINYYNLIDTIDKNYEESILKNNELIFEENEKMSQKLTSGNNKESFFKAKKKNKLKEENNEKFLNPLNNIIFNSPKDISMNENVDMNNLYEKNININNFDSHSKKKNNMNNLESKYDYEYNITNKNFTKNMFLDDLNNSKTKQQLYKYFSPKQFTDKVMKNKNKPKRNYNKDYYSINNTANDTLNKKLNYYRIKLFQEFYKHFKIFYKIRLNKYFSCFRDNIKNLKKSYKIIFKNNHNPIKNYKSRKVIIMPSNDISEELSDININSNNLIQKNKNSQINQYKKIIKKTINFSNENTKSNITNNDKNESFFSKNKAKIKSVPRKKINPNNNNYNSNLSLRRKKNDELYQIDSFSPSFQFGNKKIIIRDLSFKPEGIKNENDLYRDSKKLNKKYKQIQMRRNWSKHKTNNINSNSISISSEYIPVKTEIDSQFEKIKNYMKLMKDRKENSISKENSNVNNTFNNLTNETKKNYKNLMRFRKTDYKASKDINEIKKNHKDINNRVLKVSNDIISFNNIKNKNNKNDVNHYKNKSINSTKNKKVKTLILNTTNNKIDFNSLNILYSPKNNIYYSSYYKNNINNKTKNKIKVYNVFSTLIKNISTKDGRISIYINYYYLLNKKKSLKKKYDNLIPCNNFGINFIFNNSIKLKLSEIKEEDLVNQTDKNNLTNIENNQLRKNIVFIALKLVVRK